MEKEKVKEIELTPTEKLIGNIVGYLLLIVIALVITGCTALVFYIPPEGETENKNIIKKETFSGQWAFNVDEVEVWHVWVSKESKLDGAKVVIEGKAYALTRNLTDLEFLPYKYWKDGEKKYIKGYGEVCKDLLVENNICKVSLLDTINYIDTLPTQ